MTGIEEIADSISAELQDRLPRQRKTQRTKLALLVATMLDVRSANLMDLAAGLPRQADRTDMRYQWITRLLGNPLVISDEIMEPFSREVLERAAATGEPLSLILDQSKMSDRHQVLMLALRWGERALPLAWRVEETDGAIGFDTQQALLEAVARWLPEEASVRLMGDRFYGTADLIGWCQGRGIGCGSRATLPCLMPLARRRPGSAPRTGFTISKMSNSPLGGRAPTSASSMTPATPSPGLSPCLRNPAICELLSIRLAGASSRCSRTSNRAASASKTPSYATPTASIA
jgi:hypothetical protein